MRRDPKLRNFEYLAICEKTKAGEPHLHILFRSGFIPQKLISDWMNELEEAPIVDIRKIRNEKAAVAYVSKYIGKAPGQFGTFKRYFSTRGYEIKDDEAGEADESERPEFTLFLGGMHEVVMAWHLEGWTGRREGTHGMKFFRASWLKP